jgi:hypothetical protein
VAAKTKLKHVTQDGHVETRTTAADYTHVVVGHGTPWQCEPGWYVIRWSKSEASASKAIAECGRYGYTGVHVEAVNGGERS